MNMYGGHHDYSLYLLDMSSTDPSFMESLYSSRPRSNIFYNGDYDYDYAMMNRAAQQSPSVSVRSEGDKNRCKNRSTSPPKHRHDGTSPLPLGMDWSPPPRVWDGRNSVWPHDSHSGWSYCVTVPSWTIVPKNRASDSIVFYRVQIGVQSPEGITSVRGILRRYSDFLKLSSELKKEFPKKKLPPAPPKGILRLKNKELMEERRCSLEDWMEKLLSVIDISRSLPVATFLELEAAARSSFHETYQEGIDANLAAGGLVPSDHIFIPSDSSLVAGTSFASDSAIDSACEISEVETSRHGRDIHTEIYKDKFDQKLRNPTRSGENDDFLRNSVVSPSKELVQGDQEESYSDSELLRSRDTSIDQHGSDKECQFLTSNVNIDTSQAMSHSVDEITDSSAVESYKSGSHPRRLLQDSLESNITSSAKLELPESVEAKHNELSAISGLEVAHYLSIALPTDEQQKINRVLTTMQQRLATARTDIEDLIARLNQELAIRQYLSTKVKDLEIELETTKQSKEESLQQAVLSERERVTQLQWDMEELRRNCMEMELKLKYEQEEKLLLESAKTSAIQENESLLGELEIVREQAGNLLKLHEESELKSKSDVKILAKEIKALRSSQTELKKEISRLTNEKVAAERILQEERQRRECASAANAKLLHECEILRSRLEECSVNFLVEEENKLIMDTSSPSEAMDIMTTSDNRIGLLLAEAQLLAQDMEKAICTSSIDVGRTRTTDDELRKMLTDVFIDNASLRKKINSVIRYALRTPENTETDKEDISLSGSALSKFLEK